MSNQSIPLLARWRFATLPSAFLLAAQLLSLALYAAFDGTSSGRGIIAVFGLLVLVLAVWVVNHSPGPNWVAWVLASLAGVLTVVSELVTVNPLLAAWAAVFAAALYYYAAGSLIAYMMGDRRVTVDELYAAGATFTLLAWGFAYLYLVCQAWFPGSFTGALRPGEQRTFIELMALSFTNLTATGLGDVIPLSAPARVLVMLEQFAGIGYLAMVVSRLVGMTLATQERGK